MSEVESTESASPAQVELWNMQTDLANATTILNGKLASHVLTSFSVADLSELIRAEMHYYGVVYRKTSTALQTCSFIQAEEMVRHGQTKKALCKLRSATSTLVSRFAEELRMLESDVNGLLKLLDIAENNPYNVNAVRQYFTTEIKSHRNIEITLAKFNKRSDGEIYIDHVILVVVAEIGLLVERCTAIMLNSIR